LSEVSREMEDYELPDMLKKMKEEEAQNGQGD